jgi:AcrR family transcriptional regulator
MSPYHHGSLRETLIDAAAFLAAEQGLAAVSLREAARRAGVTQAAPYHYFPNKAALLSAVAEKGFAALGAAQTESLDRTGDAPLARLAALVRVYLRFAIEQPHYFTVMFRERCAPGPAAALVIDRFAEAVRAARLAAGHDDLDSAAIGTLIWAVPHGLASLYACGPIASQGITPTALEHIAARAVETLIAITTDDAAEDWGV